MNLQGRTPITNGFPGSRIKNNMDNSYKLCLVGSTKDGNKVFCTFKCGKKTIIRGFYDFVSELFTITQITPDITGHIPEGMSVEDVIHRFNEELISEHDWELNPSYYTKDKIRLLMKNKRKRKKKRINKKAYGRRKNIG